MGSSPGNLDFVTYAPARLLSKLPFFRRTTWLVKMTSPRQTEIGARVDSVAASVRRSEWSFRRAQIRGNEYDSNLWKFPSWIFIARPTRNARGLRSLARRTASSSSGGGCFAEREAQKGSLPTQTTSSFLTPPTPTVTPIRSPAAMTAQSLE